MKIHNGATGAQRHLCALLRVLYRPKNQADRSASVPLTFSELERWDKTGQIHQVDILNNVRTIRLE